MILDLPSEVIPERKVPVVTRKEYTLYLERTSGMTFIHCDVHTRWTPSVRFQLDLDFRDLLHLHTEPLFALHDPGDCKHEKFLGLFGFTFTTSFAAPDGTELHLYKIN